jgi:chaperonin GroES|tara:strand:- start:194 stop:493 length:300 start_codon:yes stop_codon:yes gene_type:complete
MLRPLDARVVVKKQEREEQTASGIFLPDTASEQGQTAIGEVLAVGPGSRNMMNGEVMPMPIEVGETILYTKFGGTEVIHNGEEFILMAEKDIIAVIEDK